MKFVYRRNWDHFPLLIIPTPGPTPEEDIDQDSFYQRADEALSQPDSVVVLHDISGARAPGPMRRKRFIEYAQKNEDRVRATVEAYGVLIDSQMLRGVITAVLWFITPPCPIRVFTDRAKALAWLRSMSSTLSDARDRPSP